MKQLAWILAAIALVGCSGGGGGSPTIPSKPPLTPGSGTTTTVPPTSSSLSGFASTPAGTRIAGAVVTVSDGPSAGQTATTNSTGDYQFPSLAFGVTNLIARATGFEDRTGNVTVNGTNQLNFTMRRPPQTISETYTGTLSTLDMTCTSTDFTHDNKACRRHAFEITNSGVLNASLTWPNLSDLDLELWNGSTLVFSTGQVTKPEVLSSNVSAGLYEIRVVYFNGVQTENYTLSVSRPN